MTGPEIPQDPPEEQQTGDQSPGDVDATGSEAADKPSGHADPHGATEQIGRGDPHIAPDQIGRGDPH
jgi:hypothetical protein